MPDVNEIKAGRYVLLDLQWDEPTSKPNDPVFTFERHYQGDVLDLSEAEARRLVRAGSVEPEGQRQKREAESQLERFRAALANVPDDVKARLLADLTAEQLAAAELPDEARTVHSPDVPGFTPAGHVGYVTAAHGEGADGPDPQSVNHDGPGDGEADQANAASKVEAQTGAEDDGTKNTAQSRKARGRD